MKNFSVSMTDKRVAAELFERIESRRKVLKITQVDMAKRIDVTPKTYRSLKDGTCSVMVLFTVLRQLNLLENLDALIPLQTVRPMDIWKQTNTSKAARKHRNKQNSIRDVINSRSRLKTQDGA